MKSDNNPPATIHIRIRVSAEAIVSEILLPAIFICDRRTTNGRPISERIAEARIYNTTFDRYHTESSTIVMIAIVTIPFNIFSPVII
jgi:hypothetical protein